MSTASRRFLVRCLGAILLAVALGAPASGGTSPVQASPDAPGPVAFESAWPAGVQRRWIGPEYWANRLQDWRLRSGRLECVQGADRFPLRTLHLLTRRARAEPGTLTMSVRTGPIDPVADGPPRGWSGFLIGAGGDHVDYRLTALVHHRPAADGGLLAVVDPSGQVAFRDNSRSAAAGTLWSIRGPIADGDVPVVESSSGRGAGRGMDHGGPVDLRLEVRPAGTAYRLHLSARDAATGQLLSEATLDEVQPPQVDGGLALVSHLGPAGSARGFWFQDWRLAGSKVGAHGDRAFGPVLCVQYTLGRDVLKLTAQMGPLGRDDTRTAALQVRDPGGAWRTAADAGLVDDSFTFHFKVQGWDSTRDQPYRILYDLAAGDGRAKPYEYHGTIRREPRAKPEIVIASFTGHKIYTGGLRWNHEGIWFPHAELVDALGFHDPDLLFFSGDQIYEGDLDPAQARPEDAALLDYLYKWYRWCWAFGGLTRDVPAVTIPDDHDVYHGNLWGAGGKRARAEPGTTAQDSGGYKMSPRFVNAVHRTQTGHLPDPWDPRPIGAGYTVYFTRLDYAGVSYAILADRQFKSSPTVMVPEGRVVNGWFQNPDFDPAGQADVPGAVLLGERQLAMLREWSVDFADGVWMKVALSQTPFANVATLPEDATSGAVIPSLPYRPEHEYPENHKLAADADSNGWPQSGRNRALGELRRGFAIHLAGDQHLGSLIEYGIDQARDAGFAFSAPAIANTWPRRWFPPEPGRNRKPGAPRYCGDYRDGFGNLMTVHAVSNPVISGHEPANLYDRAPGYGIVRLDRRTRRITFECWPRWVDPSGPGAAQYEGWPRTINQIDNYGPMPVGWLPTIRVTGAEDFVVQIRNEATREIEYAIRARGDTYHPMVFGQGPYTVSIGEPSTSRMRTVSGLTPRPDQRQVIEVEW
ncbi:MAG: alkaline phosphatase D family protein [Planctomycetota bacterium]|jgi:hypothetical protein